MKQQVTVLAFAMLLALPALPSEGADWPTFAHDNARSFVTGESLRPPLHLQWEYAPPGPPAPGWSLPVNGYGARKTKSNVSFDDSHPAILVGDLVFFCSSAENCVYAIEAKSGKIRWTFHTGAAPRLAPTFWEGKILFGADDGRVYCLYCQSPELVKVAGHELPWLLTSGYHGSKDLTFQLQEKGTSAARYTVTLFFAELRDMRPGERVFSAAMQGQPILKDIDVVARAGGPKRALTQVVRGVSVDQHLRIGLIPTKGSDPPILSAASIEKE